MINRDIKKEFYSTALKISNMSSQICNISVENISPQTKKYLEFIICEINQFNTYTYTKQTDIKKIRILYTLIKSLYEELKIDFSTDKK